MSAIANGGILYGAEPKIEQIVNGDNSKELTYAEYKALSEEEKKNGTTYYVPDVESVDITNILDTKADIEANTNENKIAGALAVKEVFNNFKDFIKLAVSSETKSFTANTRLNITFTPPVLEGYKPVALLGVYSTVSNSFTTHFIMNNNYTVQCSNGSSGDLTIGGIFLMVRDL